MPKHRRRQINLPVKGGKRGEMLPTLGVAEFLLVAHTQLAAKSGKVITALE